MPLATCIRRNTPQKRPYFGGNACAGCGAMDGMPIHQSICRVSVRLLAAFTAAAVCVARAGMDTASRLAEV